MDIVGLEKLSSAVAEYAASLDISGDNPGAWMEIQKLVKELKSDAKFANKPETFSAIFKYVAQYNRAVALCDRLREMFAIYTPKIAGTSGLSVKTTEKYASDLRKLSTLTIEPPTYDEYVPPEFSSVDLRTISEIYETYIEKGKSKYVVDLYIAMLKSAMKTRGREVDAYLDNIKRDILEKGVEPKRDKAPNLPQFLIQRLNLTPTPGKAVVSPGSAVLYNLSEVDYSIANLATRDAVLPHNAGISKRFLDSTVTITSLDPAGKLSSKLELPKGAITDVLETSDGKTFHRLVGSGVDQLRDATTKAPSMRLAGYNAILDDVIFAKRGKIPEPESLEKINIDRIAEELVEKSSGFTKAKLCKDEFITTIVDTIIGDDVMTIEVRLSFLQDELKLSRSLRKDMEVAISGLDAKPSRADLLAMFRDIVGKNINKRGTIIENMRKTARIFHR